MKLFTACSLAMFLSFTVSCGSSDEPDSKDSGSVTDTGATDTGATDTGSTDTGSTDTTGNTAEYAEQICNRINTCMTELTCTQPVQIDLEGCIQQFSDQGVTAEEAAAWEANSCDAINEMQCTDETVQSNCECAEAPQGNCPEGYLCNIPLQGGQYACGETGGTIPADAPVCNEQTACPDQENNQVCVTTSAGATDGSCIYLCER